MKLTNIHQQLWFSLITLKSQKEKEIAYTTVNSICSMGGEAECDDSALVYISLVSAFLFLFKGQKTNYSGHNDGKGEVTIGVRKYIIMYQNFYLYFLFFFQYSKRIIGCST